MLQRHWELRDLGGKCVCVAPCHWGARNMLVQTSVAGERDDLWYHVMIFLPVGAWADRVATRRS